MLNSILQRQIVVVLIAALWLAGVNHCAVEMLLFSHSPTTAECPAHQQGSADSHTESQPCGQNSMSAYSSLLKDLSARALVFVDHFCSGHFQVFEQAQYFTALYSIIDKTDNIAHFHLGALESLSIAPNAPPLHLHLNF